MLKRRTRRGSPAAVIIEALEPRALFSAALMPAFKLDRPIAARKPAVVTVTAHSTLAFATRTGASATPSDTSYPGSAFTVSQIRHAYGMDSVMFGNLVGDGYGQTIAIIDAYHYPTAYNDLLAFDAAMGLPDLAAYTGPNMTTPYFRQVAQDGSTTYPTNAAIGGWAEEAAMDIQWAHAMAPRANIILVEAKSASLTDLLQNAVNWARFQEGVSVVSMSFGATEFSSETSFDQYFLAPTGHAPITFIASTGDAGAPAQYPSFSPNVVAMGGTSLYMAGGEYSSETVWNNGSGATGGGISIYENKPSYQSAVTQSATKRTAPDISLVADPYTGVGVYDSYDNSGSPWIQLGGTSLSAPLFAGMMAVANQGRAIAGLAPLASASGTLAKLYAASSGDFRDIVSGNNNGFSADVGYDLASGIGSPILSAVVPDLVGATTEISGVTYSDNNASGTFDSGDAGIAGVTLFLDANNNGTLDAAASASQSASGLNLTIPDGNSAGLTNSLSISGLAGSVSHLTVTLNVSHPRDSQLSAYLIGPDGTQITLFSGVGGSGANFTNTTFDNYASTFINTASAPFSGTYLPTAAVLGVFSGKPANGTWSLKLVDSDGRFKAVGTLNSWSIAVTIAGETTATSASDGTYAFGPLAAGSYTVREVLPAGYSSSAPASYAAVLPPAFGSANFANTPILAQSSFTVAGPNDIFHLWVDAGDPTKLDIGKSATATNPISQLTLASVSSLTFNLTAAGCKLIVDYANGSPIPSGNLYVNGGNLADSELQVFGHGASFYLGNTTLGPATGGVISYSGLGTLSLWDNDTYLSGDLSTLQYLNINSGCVFHWFW